MALTELTTEELLGRVDELLEAKYRSESLGNLKDPLDELIYIILSVQTGPNGYRPVFASLKQRYPYWDNVLEASEKELESIIRPAGLSKQKTRYIRAIVAGVLQETQARTRNSRAKATLNFLKKDSNEEAEAFLVSLPGVSVKTARCVLMYSLGRDVFPVDTHIYRIFNRLGIAEPIHRKRAGDPMQDLVPPSIRRRLHINLVHQGRAVCKSRKPLCSACPLVSFCKTGLDRHRREEKRRPVAVDLFAGPGGLSVGFRQAGYRVAFSADSDRDAAQTYRFNHPGVPVVETDVSRLKGKDILRYAGLRKGEVDVLLGGPPCQGYSQAGKRDPGAEQNLLYRHFARIGKELDARLLIMENVPGVQNVRGRQFIRDIRSYFLRRGLEARDFLLNAASYGVPQSRTRVVLLAARKGSRIGSKLSAPAPTHALSAGEDSDEPLAVTVKVALGGLPIRASGQGRDVDEWNGTPVYNHVSMKHSKAVTAKIRDIKSGSGPLSYRRLTLNQPSSTIIAGHRALPVHPTANRTITAREAARLQSFRDDYRFLGPRGNWPLQVANAVPPLLAEALAKHVWPWLAAYWEKQP